MARRIEGETLVVGLPRKIIRPGGALTFALLQSSHDTSDPFSPFRDRRNGNAPSRRAAPSGRACLCRVMVWSDVSMAKRYVHPGDDVILRAMSQKESLQLVETKKGTRGD